MLIGELARQSGFSRDTIRYYEKLGLLARAPQSSNGYKIYAYNTLQRLQQIGQLKQIGFTLDEIQMLLGTFESAQPCADLPALLDQKIALIDRKIAQLMQYQKNLHTARQTCSTECKPNDGLPSCLAGAQVKFYSPDV